VKVCHLTSIIYDAIGESRGQVSGPFPVLPNSPEVASRIAPLGHFIRYESILKPMIRELAILTVAREFDWPVRMDIPRFPSASGRGA
jgi:4-carboxymuconolactone decarboxylase